MTAKQGARPWPKEEHVTIAEQFVSTVLIEYDTAVGSAGDLEADPSGEVALDQACDNIDGWLLCCKNQMDTDGSALLGQSNDVSFDLFTSGHHQVRHFVRDDDDEW